MIILSLLVSLHMLCKEQDSQAFAFFTCMIIITLSSNSLADGAIFFLELWKMKRTFPLHYWSTIYTLPNCFKNSRTMHMEQLFSVAERYIKH